MQRAILHWIALFLAITETRIVIARNEAIQKSQTIKVLQNLSLRACEAIQRKNRRHYFSILVTLPFEGGRRMESIF